MFVGGGITPDLWQDLDLGAVEPAVQARMARSVGMALIATVLRWRRTNLRKASLPNAGSGITAVAIFVTYADRCACPRLAIGGTKLVWVQISMRTPATWRP